MKMNWVEVKLMLPTAGLRYHRNTSELPKAQLDLDRQKGHHFPISYRYQYQRVNRQKSDGFARLLAKKQMIILANLLALVAVQGVPLLAMGLGNPLITKHH